MSKAPKKTKAQIEADKAAAEAAAEAERKAAEERALAELKRLEEEARQARLRAEECVYQVFRATDSAMLYRYLISPHLLS